MTKRASWLCAACGQAVYGFETLTEAEEAFQKHKRDCRSLVRDTKTFKKMLKLANDMWHQSKAWFRD